MQRKKASGRLVDGRARGVPGGSLRDVNQSAVFALNEKIFCFLPGKFTW